MATGRSQRERVRWVSAAQFILGLVLLSYTVNDTHPAVAVVLGVLLLTLGVGSLVSQSKPR